MVVSKRRDSVSSDRRLRLVDEGAYPGLAARVGADRSAAHPDRVPVLELHEGGHADEVVQRLLSEEEVAQGVEDRLAAVYLDRLDLVRPVAHDQVGARVDGRVSDGHLVVGRLDAAGYAPMEGGDEEVDALPQRRDVAPERVQILGVGPRHDDRRPARHLGDALVGPVGGVGEYRGDSGAAVRGLVAEGPEHGRVLQEAEPDAVALDDGGRAGGGPVGPRAGVGDPHLVQPRHRRHDGLGAEVHVVGASQGVEAAVHEGGRRLGPDVVPAGLVVHRDGRIVQAPFEIAEDDVGLAQNVSDQGERLRRVSDVPKVNVARQNERLSHASLLAGPAVVRIIAEAPARRRRPSGRPVRPGPCVERSTRARWRPGRPGTRATWAGRAAEAARPGE